MSVYINKSQSLIERKKAQWAREREELADLSPWNCIRESIENISRRPSLPPIYKNQNQFNGDKEMGGETSGYGSDNPNNNTPEYLQQSWNQHLGYESSGSARDDRAKWGDRGVSMGKFWEPQTMNFSKDDTPGWVKRGLQGETEVIVSNSSPAESPEQDDDQRPYTSSTISQTRTYIRGQNNPVDPVELAERERKRQAALAHQEAIKQQLEEREQRRKEDREKKLREEHEEEMRIAREQEIERKRREREQEILREKQDNERKRKKALEEAIEIAEKEAQEFKNKQKLMKQVNINISENVEEKEKVISPRLITPTCDDNKNKKNEDKPNNMSFITNQTKPNSARANEKKENNLNRNCSERNPTPLPPSKQNLPENVTMLLQAPYDGVPFAILMPTFTPGQTNISTPLPIAVQIPNQTPRTENRILTPTQYRNRQYCDSSTQTDVEHSIRCIREKFANIDVTYEGRSSRKERSRTSERSARESDRPKWGANRPPTRYMKQSEKDPFYQRKKTRQKPRQEKNNNYSPHSSDESQPATPRTYRKKYIEKRRTRALWQKNVQVYQTEIVPLDTDKERIYYGKTECIKCCCDCRSEKHKYSREVNILKIEHTPREEIQLPDCNNSSIDSEVLEKLNSLHNGLIFKQEQWKNSNQSLSSPKIDI